MGLQSYAFQTEYRSGYDDLIRDFYHPGLDRADRYWRAVGFFSSSAFEALGRPLGEFIAKGGMMRLITSVRLEPEDILAIAQGIDRRRVCEQRLLEQIKTEFVAPLGRGASLLASLLEVGSLEIQISVPDSGQGIYHEKVGVFIDAGGDYVSFSGSSNESRSALEVNYECIDVYPSWEELSRALAKRRHFELLWQGKARGVETMPFPEAAKRELIRKHHEGSEADSPATARASGLWRHQREAVETFLEKRRGVLEMATGTGKTRTALRICQRLLQDQAIDTIIVTTDGNDLLDQWYLQLLELTKQIAVRFGIIRHYDTHHERDYFVLDPRRTILLVSRLALAPALESLPPADASRTLLIHDEVHRLGSPGNRQALTGLSDNIRFRLGLSATPEREYDRDGNLFIEAHVGPVLVQFGLEDAIRRGILAPFAYHPIEYCPDVADRRRLQQVYRKAAARKQSGTPMSPEEIWIDLAKVYKTSRTKLPLFEDFIRHHQDLLKRCIIFVETHEYGDEVLPIVHQYRHDFHTYYAEEDSSTLRRFANGDIECLLTCHRLSEGIDIRSLETVILFSSARARLETIQRMGRCLRIDPGNPRKRANVVDFVRVSDADGAPDDDNADQEQRTGSPTYPQSSLKGRDHDFGSEDQRRDRRGE